MSGDASKPSVPRLLRATPSSLATFADCPRRFRFSYLDRPAPARRSGWAHNSLGRAVHIALARWWDVPAPRRTQDTAERLTATAWQHDGFRDVEQSELWRSRAITWVRAYVRGLDPAAEPRGVERTVAARTRVLALSGRIDRVDDRDGELVVVDYKTGRSALTDHDARTSPALALYAYAAAATLRRPCVRVELHGMRTQTVVAHTHTPESLARQVRRAEDIGTDVLALQDALASGGDPDLLFETRPSVLCGWCDFRPHCADGQAAAPAQDSWAGLEGAR